MIYGNTFPSLVLRPHPRGESGDIWPIPWALLTLITFWGEFSICRSHCRKRHLWLQHWKLLATSAQWPQFEKWARPITSISTDCKLWIFDKARGISQVPPSGWVLHETTWWISCLITLLGQWNMQTPSRLCYNSLIPRPRERRDSPPMRPGYEAIATCICTIVPS